MEAFDPEKVPTVGQLLRELDRPVVKGEGEMDVDMDMDAGGAEGAKRQAPG